MSPLSIPLKSQREKSSRARAGSYGDNDRLVRITRSFRKWRFFILK